MDDSRLTAASDAVAEVIEAIGNLVSSHHEQAELERAARIIVTERLVALHLPTTDTHGLLAWIDSRAQLRALMRANPALYQRALALIGDRDAN